MSNRSGIARLPASKTSTIVPLKTKDFLSVLDLEPAELDRVLELAAHLKRDRATGHTGSGPLAGQHVALLFDKPSLRTRATFVIAIHELGGQIIEPLADAAFGSREALGDVAKSLERWVTTAVVRTLGLARLQQFASAAPGLHVINALTSDQHPCQALADFLTLQEHVGPLTGRTLAFVGDGNNVAASLAHAGAMLGVHVRIASPAGFELPDEVVDAAKAVSRAGATLTLTDDPIEAVTGADAVYTDAWASMGQEHEADARALVFRPYQVNAALMRLAAPKALFMHCLPAHRGEEVTDEVMDSRASIVFDQAENRLHAQKALLTLLAGQ
jgi:ornithine carbamoyltransferase